MARTPAAHIRQRRMQRWLRREAALLARQAQTFECVDATKAAERLADIVEGRAGVLYVAQSA